MACMMAISFLNVPLCQCKNVRQILIPRAWTGHCLMVRGPGVEAFRVHKGISPQILRIFKILGSCSAHWQLLDSPGLAALA